MSGGPSLRHGVVLVLWVLVIAVVFRMTSRWITQTPAVETFRDEGLFTAELEIWLAMLSILAAVSVGLGSLFVVWCIGVVRDFALPIGTWITWTLSSLVVLVLMFYGLIASSELVETHPLSRRFTDMVRPLSVLVAACCVPGLSYLGLLRSAAASDPPFAPPDSGIDRLFEIRRSLDRATAGLGAILTLIVIATGYDRGDIHLGR